MSRPIKIKINYTRIVQSALYDGKNGQYLDLVAWPNKNGPDQYGNTHMVCQELPREAREAGERGPILGNLRLPEDQDSVPVHHHLKRKETANTEAARKWDEQRRAREDQQADAALQSSGPMSRPLSEADDEIPF